MEPEQVGAGPWRFSKTPALTLALPARYFSGLGLPQSGSEVGYVFEPPYT